MTNPPQSDQPHDSAPTEPPYAGSVSVAGPAAASGYAPVPDPQARPAGGRPRPGWPVVTGVGVGGLILGLILGAVGFGLVSAVWQHGGPGDRRGDDRGWHDRDDVRIDPGRPAR